MAQGLGHLSSYETNACKSLPVSDRTLPEGGCFQCDFFCFEGIEHDGISLSFEIIELEALTRG